MNLASLLEDLRAERGFSVSEYVSKKVELINRYFRAWNLDAAVVGISGGIDSAVVAGLLDEARCQKDSPIKKIIGVMAPMYGSGATNQADALDKGRAVCKAFRLTPWEVDLTGAKNIIVSNARANLPVQNREGWTAGQLVSALRTPLFYYVAALLQDQGYKSIVVGTTNMSEGSYLGFYGKASDGMVDLQPISDIFKSEVYTVAACLGVPLQVPATVPRGDVWDGRNDEQMIGAPYWFVELVLTGLMQNTIDLGDRFAKLLPAERDLFNQYTDKMRALHFTNSHKYTVGSPAVHLDVMPRLILKKGIWNDGPATPERCSPW